MTPSMLAGWIPRLPAIVAAAFVGMVTCSAAHAQEIVHPQPNSPLRAQILEAVRPVFAGDTYGPVEFVVRQLNVADGWAFGDISLQRPGGAPIDWGKTKFADANKRGFFDPSGSFFLLKQIDASWAIVEHATGPSDAPWFGWQTDHHLSEKLFERPNAK